MAGYTNGQIFEWPYTIRYTHVRSGVPRREKQATTTLYVRTNLNRDINLITSQILNMFSSLFFK